MRLIFGTPTWMDIKNEEKDSLLIEKERTMNTNYRKIIKNIKNIKFMWKRYDIYAKSSICRTVQNVFPPIKNLFLQKFERV